MLSPPSEQDTHRAKVEASASMNPAKRHHPDPGAAAAMAAMHEHQMAAMFAANAAAGMAAMHTLPGLAQGLAGPNGPGPHLKDEKVEVREKECGLRSMNKRHLLVRMRGMFRRYLTR